MKIVLWMGLEAALTQERATYGWVIGLTHYSILPWILHSQFSLSIAHGGLKTLTAKSSLAEVPCWTWIYFQICALVSKYSSSSCIKFSIKCWFSVVYDQKTCGSFKSIQYSINTLLVIIKLYHCNTYLCSCVQHIHCI